MKAVYLGGGGVPYTVITGSNPEEIRTKAENFEVNGEKVGINPANLYSADNLGFGYSADDLPSGNTQAEQDLGISSSSSGSSGSSGSNTGGSTHPSQDSVYVNAISEELGIDPSEVTNNMVTIAKNNSLDRGDLRSMRNWMDQVYNSYLNRAPTTSDYERELNENADAISRRDTGAYNEWKENIQNLAKGEQTDSGVDTGTETGEEQGELNNVYLGDSEGNPYQIIPGKTQQEVNANASNLGINPANLQPLEGNTWEEIKAQKTENLQNALNIIDDAVANGVITSEMGDFYKRVVKEYEGEDVKVDEIMKTYQKIKEDTIDPFYEELADISTEELQRNVEQLKTARERELEVQETKEEQDIRQSRANLEQSGLLNTGESVKQLGQLSPYQTAMEGLIPQQHRIISSSTQDQYHNRLGQLARTSEKYFGSVPAGTFAGTGWNYDSMGVDKTAELPYQKEQAMGGVLGSLIGSSVQKEAGLGNLKFNFPQYN